MSASDISSIRCMPAVAFSAAWIALADVKPAQPGQLLRGIVDAQADERVAAAQMVVEEGERRRRR